MGLEQVREVLRGLSCSHGWLYGLLWQIRSRDSMLLMPEDVYYEEKIGPVIERMLHQVHVVGEGIIGQAAFGGQHRWVFSDTYYEEASLVGLGQRQVGFQDTAEWEHQFSAGIKTVALVPLSSQSVLQFGSDQKIAENLEFVNSTKALFRQLESSPEAFLSGNVENSCNSFFGGLNEVYTSGVSSYDAFPNFHDIKSFTEESPEELNTRRRFLSSIALSHDPFLSGFLHDSSLPCATAQVILASPEMQSTQMRLQSSSSHFNNLLPSTTSSTKSNDFSSLTVMEQKLSRMDIQRPSNLLLPTNVHGISGLTSRSNVTAAEKGDGTFFADEKLTDGQNSDVFLGSINGQLPIGNACVNDMPTLPEPLQSSATFGMPKESNESFNGNILNIMNQWPNSSLGKANNSWIGQHSGEMLPPTSAASLPLKGLVEDGSNEFPTGHGLKRSAVDSSISTISASGAKECSMDASIQLPTGEDMFDSLEDIVIPGKNRSSRSLQASVSECISELEMASFSMIDKEFVTELGHEQLLDAVVRNLNSSTNQISDDISSISTNSGTASTSRYSNQIPMLSHSCLSGSLDTMTHGFSADKSPYETVKNSLTKSLVSSWINSTFSVKSESGVTVQTKRTDEPAKVARKRARPGESTRPRPKDRQLIQDRVKELREIVPNGAKCSIDSLLDRTIKHMLYLQSVSKYADKLKQVDEPKIMDGETGVVSRDMSGHNLGSTRGAFEVGGQTMVCPIKVEDLNPPGQMLVEMLCEERGFFLEIADIIRGFGLTILKGLMEVREDKIWARFVVEANREVTRMDIFLSLVHLLQQTVTNNSSSVKLENSECPMLAKYQQSSVPLPVGLTDGL